MHEFEGLPSGACRSRGRRGGFTLVEVLITLGLIVVFLFPLMRMFAALAVMSADAETGAVAAALAEDRMETLLRVSFSALANEARAAVPNFGLFEREVAVSATGDADVKDVRVTVYWTLGNRAKSVVLRTLRANIG